MKYKAFVFIFFATVACVRGQKELSSTATLPPSQDDSYEYVDMLEQSLIGEWSNVSMRVWVKTYQNSDTSFIVDVPEESWEVKMNIKPIVTTIRDDGTYSSEFRTSFDSLIYRPEGTWMLDGDSLIMEDHQAVYKYQVFIDGDRAEFTSLLDWDKDGKADDEYLGVQRKNY